MSDYTTDSNFVTSRDRAAIVTILQIVMAAVAFVILTPVIVLLNPLVASLALVGAAVFALSRDPLRRVRGQIIIATIAALAVYAAVDTSFAYRRVQYGKAIPSVPAVRSTIPTPSSVVLVNVHCDQSCLQRLVAGVHDEIIHVSTIRHDNNLPVQIDPPYPASRYTVKRMEGESCPPDLDRRMEWRWTTAVIAELRTRGLCPSIEPAAVPQDGIFIVSEWRRVGAAERAVSFDPRFLTEKPPGRIIYFFGVEVQKRSASAVDVLGASYHYSAPGYLGVPPLAGCWARPDNVIWIMPAGDTGCGLWRLITYGGKESGNYSDTDWVYSRLFQ